MSNQIKSKKLGDDYIQSIRALENEASFDNNTSINNEGSGFKPSVKHMEISF